MGQYLQLETKMAKYITPDVYRRTEGMGNRMQITVENSVNIWDYRRIDKKKKRDMSDRTCRTDR